MSLSLILKCNNIKKMKVSEEQLVKAIKDSELVEMNDDHTLIRRKNNKPVPELVSQDIKTKKVKQTSQDIIGTVYTIESQKEQTDKELLWTKVKENIREQFNIELIYITFDKALLKGYIVVDQKDNQDKVKSQIDIEGIAFNIKRAEAMVLKEFWNKHGNHYSGILKKLQSIKKAEQKKITFMGNVYQDSDKLK